MSSERAFQLVARMATATAGLMFGLIVVGSIVRTTGSGLSCPDWPLCRGHLIPPMQFNVLMEWLHRLVALCVGVLLLGTSLTVLGARATRGRLGGFALLALALYVAQALLGALTVWKLLDPAVVSGHLAVGLLLFSTLVTLAVRARIESGAAIRVRADAPAGLLGVATLLTYLQAVLGGMVSTNHASLACPDWPTCNGAWFPPLTGLVGLQVAHRFGAYVLASVLLAVAVRTRHDADPVIRTIGRWTGALVLAQVVIGVTNVLLGIPVWVSALHLGNAAAILALLLVATLRAASARAGAPALAAIPAGAR